MYFKIWESIKSSKCVKNKQESTHITLYLCNDCGSGFVNDGVNLLDDVKVSLVVCVFDTGASPGNVGELTCRQSATHAEDK